MILNRKSSEAEILENFGLLNIKILNPQEKLLENLVTNFVLEVDISLFKFSSSFKKEEPAYLSIKFLRNVRFHSIDTNSNLNIDLDESLFDFITI